MSGEKTTSSTSSPVRGRSRGSHSNKIKFLCTPTLTRSTGRRIPYSNTETSNASNVDNLQQKKSHLKTPVRLSHEHKVKGGITSKSVDPGVREKKPWIQKCISEVNSSSDSSGPTVPSTDWEDDSTKSPVSSLPNSRPLGVSHTNIESFLKSFLSTGPNSIPSTSSPQVPEPKHKFVLIVVTESRCRRILLGKKKRATGNESYYAFSDAIGPSDETPAHAAARNLLKETSIQVPVEVVQRGSIGMMYLTFQEDLRNEMLVYIYHIDLICQAMQESAVKGIDATFFDESRIKGVNGLKLPWIKNWKNLPLDHMHSTYSLWLPMLIKNLEKEERNVMSNKLMFTAWFHCNSFCFSKSSHVLHSFITEKKNDILEILSPETAIKSQKEEMDTISQLPSVSSLDNSSVKKQLFHELERLKVNSPAIEDFKTCWAFVNTTQSFYEKKNFDVILDVAGSHGALAALFLILTTASEAIVIDPVVVGKDGVRNAWGSFFQDKELRYRHESLRTALPDELQRMTVANADQSNAEDAVVDPKRILVVASHTCQALTDEILAIACSFGANVTVMPSFEEDRNDKSFNLFKNQIGVNVGDVMDLLAAGKIVSWNNGTEIGASYEVKLGSIDETTTASQNRMIFCKTKNVIDMTKINPSKILQHASENSNFSESYNSIRSKRSAQQIRELGVRLSMLKYAQTTTNNNTKSTTTTTITEEVESLDDDTKLKDEEDSTACSQQSPPVYGPFLQSTKPATTMNSRTLSINEFARNSFEAHKEKLEGISNAFHSTVVHGTTMGMDLKRNLQHASPEKVAAGAFLAGTALSVMLSKRT